MSITNGIINVYKEKGFTSHDVVAKLRGIFKQKKIGHTGTLDPDAEGVLPVCLGNATKLCDLITAKEKTYKAVMLLGVSTDTEDTSGQVLEKKDTSAITKEAVAEAVRSFIGDYNQVPPMYSAIKINGKKMYELAREGKVIERPARPVYIYDIDIEQIELPRVTMTIHCSKGTYIRSLCRDIGDKLGCGACMEELLRSRSGAFGLDTALRLSEIEELVSDGTIDDKILKVDTVFKDLPSFTVEKSGKSF